VGILVYHENQYFVNDVENDPKWTQVLLYD